MGQKRRSHRVTTTSGIPLTADMWTNADPGRRGRLVLGGLTSAQGVAPAAEDYWQDWYRIWIFAR